MCGVTCDRIQSDGEDKGVAGEPTEAMIGIGALGLGAVLVFASYKNVSPVALIKTAITTGDLDWSKLPKIMEPKATTPAPGNNPPDTKVPEDLEPIIAKVRARDPQLAQNLHQGIEQVSPWLETTWAYARKQVKTAFDLAYIDTIDRAKLEAEIIKRGAK